MADAAPLDRPQPSNANEITRPKSPLKAPMPRALICGVVLLVALAPAHGQEKLLAPRTLPGGGLLDPGEKAGYFPNRTGGIDALNLATGEVLWASKDANRPLFATKDRLYAMKGGGNKIRVVALETGKAGRLLIESSPIPLPEWASVDVRHGRKFHAGARLDATGLFLVWEADAFYAGGAPPPPDLLKQYRKTARGVARIEADDGKVAPLSDKEIAAGKFFPLAEQMTLIVGDFTFREEGDSKQPANPQLQRRFVEAINPSMEVVWRREIAPQVVLLPLP